MSHYSVSSNLAERSVVCHKIRYCLRFHFVGLIFAILEVHHSGIEDLSVQDTNMLCLVEVLQCPKLTFHKLHQQQKDFDPCFDMDC